MMPSGSGYTSKGYVVGGVNSGFDSGFASFQIEGAQATTSILVKLVYNFEYEPTSSGNRLASALSNERMS
jgi:hypothetical protein